MTDQLVPTCRSAQHIEHGVVRRAHLSSLAGRAHIGQPTRQAVPVLAAWRSVRGETPGALFTRIWASSVSLEPLSPMSQPA